MCSKRDSSGKNRAVQIDEISYQNSRRRMKESKKIPVRPNEVFLVRIVLVHNMKNIYFNSSPNS